MPQTDALFAAVDGKRQDHTCRFHEQSTGLLEMREPRRRSICAGRPSSELQRGWARLLWRRDL